TVHGSRFAVRGSRFTVRGSRFAVHSTSRTHHPETSVPSIDPGRSGRSRRSRAPHPIRPDSSLRGAPPHTPARSLAGTPAPRAAPRRRAVRASALGLRPSIPARSLAGTPAPRAAPRRRAVRASALGLRPSIPARSLAGTPPPRAGPSQARRARLTWGPPHGFRLEAEDPFSAQDHAHTTTHPTCATGPRPR